MHACTHGYTHDARAHITDPRNRHVDLLANAGVRKVFEKRAAVLRAIREFLDAHSFLEVDTPSVPGCLCVCVSVCLCVCVSVCLCLLVHACILECICVFVCMHACMHGCVYDGDETPVSRVCHHVQLQSDIADGVAVIHGHALTWMSA